MGWNFRKRVKLAPGLHVNISKSGLSVNVGVKGANITITSDKIYANTGFPGTGIYRRDTIYKRKRRGRRFMDSFDSKERVATPKRLPDHRDYRVNYDGTVSIPVYSSAHYISYMIALFMPFVAFLLYTYAEWWMFFSCLLASCIQIICLGLTESSTIVKTESASGTVKKEYWGHIRRLCILCVLILLNFFPLLAMSETFLSFCYGMDYYRRPYEGGLLVFALIMIVVGICLIKLKEEWNWIKLLKKQNCQLFANSF